MSNEMNTINAPEMAQQPAFMAQQPIFAGQQPVNTENSVVEFAEAGDEIAYGSVKPRYTFRELNSTDLFPVIRIVRKIGVDKLKTVFTGGEMGAIINGGAEEMSEAGGIELMFNIAQIVLDGAANCETEIFDLLARVSDLKKEEIQQLDLATFTQMIFDFFKKAELKDFLRAVFTALGAIMN